MYKGLWLAAYLCSTALLFSQDPSSVSNVTSSPPLAQECQLASMERAVECTQEQLDQFAKYHFNTALFRGINLNERRIRIYSMFTVTETGAIENISVRAPHPVLAREMERVLALLPRLRPAREAGEAVSATFTFLIIFTLG